jgi:hypothetical protein
MKITLPNIIKCKKMYKLLDSFYMENVLKKHITDYTKFNHAIMIFCASYGLVKPHRIRFRRCFQDDKKCLGKCYESGNIDILYPCDFHGDCKWWIGVVYHELGHYYLWANAEEKAMEFELKMLKRR